MDRRKPGRRSVADLSVIPFKPRERPEPPDHLSDPGRRAWCAAVAAYPAEWFDGATPLLERYCEVVDTLCELRPYARAVGASGKPNEIGRVGRALGRETMLLVALARALRLTPQARFRRETAGSRHGGTDTPRPWEF